MTHSSLGLTQKLWLTGKVFPFSMHVEPGKDKLESKNLEVCILQDVDMVDTSALVQLAGISLE